MNTDALLVLLVLPPRSDLGAVAAQLYGAMDEVGAEIDPWPHRCTLVSGQPCLRCMPKEASTALKDARARERERRFLDRLWPSLLYRSWRPVALWLCDMGHQLMSAKGPWREVVGCLPSSIVARSRSGVAFTFAIWTEAKAAQYVTLHFDWRTFNRCPNGPDEIARIAATVGSFVGAVEGAGGPPEVWRTGVPKCIAQPAATGAMLSASRDVQRGFSEHIIEVGHFRVGWRKPVASAETREKISDSPVLGEEEILSPRWTGCSGRFALGRDGQDEAALHFAKHVLLQREWPAEDIPDVITYVAHATRALDAIENTFELWQPSNHSVVKYDPGADVIAIGSLHDGDLRTYFRPGGVDYVLRKLRAGNWVPAPLLGAVTYDRVHDDEELTALFGELERSVAQANAEACAVAANDAGHILAAIASQERAEYLRWRVRSQYLISADESRLDAIELAFAEALAALDVALEVWKQDALESAIAAAVDGYIRGAPQVFVDGDSDEVEELLALRDRIEFTRMATRGRGRIAGLARVEAFREVELVATDALIAVDPWRSVGSALAGGWPESFVWRCGDVP